MIRSIIGMSLRFRVLIIGVAVGVMAVGIVQLRNAPVDVLPEFTPPYVEVQTESLGLSANEVEQLITVPLEADLLNGVQGIDVIRSKSVPGLSDIVMVFDDKTSLYEARQLVQERLIQAHALPNVSRPPAMINPLSTSSRIMMIGLDPKELSPIEASVLARWTVKPRLLGVPGVANVAIWGSRDRQLQVQVSPEQLKDQGIKLSQVIETAGNAQLVSPLTFLEASTPGTGGFVETPNQRLQVRHVFGQLTTPEGLGQVPVDGTDGQMRLDDVANVVDGHPPLIGNAIVNGNSSGLLLVVEKFPGADTAEVSAGVQDALDNLKPGLSGMKIDTGVFQPTTYIEDALGNLKLALIVAGILLALALVAFLYQWRTVAISLIVIPLSLVAAAFVAYLLGQTFNMILFAGLAVAIAVVIDDAVVGVHNVARRLDEYRQEEGDDDSTADVVLAAYTEVRSPLVYATLIALLAIVPVVVMGGRPGAFFEPLALSYVLAVLASLVVALTVTPALSLLVFSWGSLGRRESPILRWLNPRYDGALSRFVRAPRAALIVCGVLAVVCLGTLPLLRASVIPSFEDRDVLVNLQSPPGTSESKMSATTAQLGSQLEAIAGVEKVGATVGRAVTGDQIVDVNSSQLSVRLAPDADYDSTMASIEDVVGRQDVQGSVETYSEQAIRDVGALYTGEQPKSGNGLDVLTGVHEPLVVRLYGQDLGVLRGEAEKVRGILSGVDGVVDPHVRLEPERPVIDVETNLNDALDHGIKPGDVRRSEAALVQGIQVGSIFREQKVFEVVVLGEPSVRQDEASVRNMLIDTPAGGHVRLGQVADVRTGSAPTIIERDAVARFVDVEANVSGRSLAAVAGDVNASLADLKFPLEYHAEVRQDSTSQQIGLARIAGFGVVAIIAIFLLFQAALGSWRLAAVVFLTLPVALAGGALAALIDGAALPLGASLAFLALLSVAARNGTMLIHNCQRLRTDAAQAFDADLVRRGAGERFAPVLTSASAVALVALPFVVMGDVAGLEIVHPMAIVLLGGLVTTTLLALFVLPALYLRFGAAAQPEPAAEMSLAPGADGPAGDGREAAAKRFRRSDRAPERQADAARQEDAPGERRGE